MHLLLVAFQMVVHKSLYCRVDFNVLDRSGVGFEVPPGRSVEPFGIEQPKTVFIADDSELVRAIIRQALAWSTDLRVCGEAADGTDAVSKAKELSPDLIISEA
jgi:PleD family two-component response regulator